MWQGAHASPPPCSSPPLLLSSSPPLLPARSAPPARSYAQIHARPASPSLEHKRVQAARGQYNPLTHTYTQAPDPEYVTLKDKEFARSTGTNYGVRKVLDDGYAFDPIRCASGACSAPCARAGGGGMVVGTLRCEGEVQWGSRGLEAISLVSWG